MEWESYGKLTLYYTVFTYATRIPTTPRGGVTRPFYDLNSSLMITKSEHADVSLPSNEIFNIILYRSDP